MVKFKIPKFRRSKPTTTTTTPITLPEQQLRYLMDVINNPINHSLNEVTNAVHRLRLASYKINNISANVRRILASPNNFDIDNIKSAFLISMFVEEPRQPRLYQIYTSCLRTIFSRTAPDNIRDLWRFFDRNKGPNFEGYLRTKGVTELDVEAVIVVLISVFDRSLDEVQAALATLTKIGFDKLNEEIIHEAQEILDPSRLDHEIREIKIAVEILVFSKVTLDPYIVGSDDIINNPSDKSIIQIYRAFLILKYANPNARELYPIFGRTLIRSFELSNPDKMKFILDFLIEDGGTQFKMYLAMEHVTEEEVKTVVEVLSFVFRHTADEVVSVLQILDRMGFSDLRLVQETIDRALAILNDDNVMGYPIDQIKIAYRILVWSNLPTWTKLIPYIPIPNRMEVAARNILKDLEHSSLEQIKNAFLILSYMQSTRPEIYLVYKEILQSLFLLSDVNKIKQIWEFLIEEGGPTFKGYFGELRVPESYVEELINLLASIFEHKMDEVVSAQKFLRRLGYKTHSEGIIREARVIMSDNILTKYTLEQFKIAWQILVFSNVWRTRIMYNRFHARVRFEKYPEKVTTTQFVSRLKPLVAAFGNGVVNEQYMRTSGPTIKEITSAIITINGAHNIPNKEVKKAISVLKTVNIVLDKPNIDAQLVRLDNYRNFNPEQIKNIVSILEWNKVKIPLRFKGKINTWRSQLTHPDTINEVEDVLDILDKEWKFFIRINYTAEKFKGIVDNYSKMKAVERTRLRRHLKEVRELRIFESREQLWSSVAKLKGKVIEMLRLGIFDRHDINDIESYLEQLKVDEANVLHDTAVELNEEIEQKEPLLVDWKKVGIIARDIIKWSAAFVAVDQQLRDLIKRKGKKLTRGFK